MSIGKNWVVVGRAENPVTQRLVQFLESYGHKPVCFSCYSTMRSFVIASGLPETPMAFLNGSYVGDLEAVKSLLRGFDA